MATKLQQAQEAYNNRDFDSALRLFDEVLASNPNQPDVWHDKAIALFHLERKKEALDHLNKAVEIQPDYSYRYSSRAYIRSSLKDIHGAIADYKKAIELDPEDAISYNNLGLLEEQLGYAKEAQDKFKVADELREMLEQNQIETTGEPLPDLEPRNIQKELDAEKEEEKPNSVFREMRNALFTKEGRSEFGSFLKGKWKKEE